METPDKPMACHQTHHRTRVTHVSYTGMIWLLCIYFIQTSLACEQAFIQSDKVLEELHFSDGNLSQVATDPDFSLQSQQSLASHRVNCRPICFEPSMLDFQEHPVGMPKMEKVHLHNLISEEISLISISASTTHFHVSFFQNTIIPLGGNTSFDVVFLARIVGNVENTLFINTSHHGVFTYQVFGVGIPNPYRLRPFTGDRPPLNGRFSLTNSPNPHNQPLQVVEMFSSVGDLHLELPTGEPASTRELWEIPPLDVKAVVKARAPDRFVILPVEAEVTSAAPGVYASTEMLDFGTLRSQDRPKQLNLHLFNSGAKDVAITVVRTTPSNEAVSIRFKSITLKAGESTYTKVASITFDASKARSPHQFSGKITVKAKRYSKLEIKYQAEVLEGYLGFDHTATLFHIGTSPVEPVERPIFLTNTFNVGVQIQSVSLPEEAKATFTVQNLSSPVLIPPRESRYVFSLAFRPVRLSAGVGGDMVLVTNASAFRLPVQAYTGLLEPLVLPPSPQQTILDFGVRSATEVSSITLVIVNSNPIELEVKSWLVTGDSLSMELLKTERGGGMAALSNAGELQNASSSHHKMVILASGYYAAFRVTLAAQDLKSTYHGAIHITTDYQILTVPVKALIAVGTLSCSPKHITLPPSFPGKVVHSSLSLQSSFTQQAKLQQIRSLAEDARFHYKRLRKHGDRLEPRRKTKVANIYFDAGVRCGDHCYVGLPFVPKGEPRPPGLALQEDMWDADVDLHQELLRRWKELEEDSGHKVEATFEVNTDLQKNLQAKVTARLTWPSLVNSSSRLLFPLTNINGSSDEEVVLENPADVPVFVQIFPLALFPDPSGLSERLADRLPLMNLSHIDTKTLEFQVHRYPSPQMNSNTGFTDGSSKPFVSNLLLLRPRETVSITVSFRPLSSHSVSSLLIVRNNLTVIDVVLLEGRGMTERLKVGGKRPGLDGPLRFKITEAHLRNCTEKANTWEPNFSLKRTFKVENTGLLPIHVTSTEINRQMCEGYGFKIINCQEFTLQPNSSKDLAVLFTPDFTSSQVIRELRLVTRGNSQFVFVLNASLPHHMLSACTHTLPRPGWEADLWLIMSLITSSLFLLVVAIAFWDALSLWELFRSGLSMETSSSSDTDGLFDLRKMVQTLSDTNSNYQDEPQQNHRAFYGSGSVASRVGGRHDNGRAFPSPDGQDRKSRAGFVRSLVEVATSSQPARGGTALGHVGLQPANRKARKSRQLHAVVPVEVESRGPATGAASPQRGPSPEGENWDGDLEQSAHSAEQQDKTKHQKKKKKKKKMSWKGKKSNPDADTSNLEADTSNPDAGTSNLEADTSNPDAGTSNLEADTSNPDAGTSNLEADTSNLEADTSNPDADTSNLEADTSNPDAGTSNLEADTSNPDADTSNPEADTSNPEADTSNPEADTSNPEADTSNLDADTSNPDTSNPDTSVKEKPAWKKGREETMATRHKRKPSHLLLDPTTKKPGPAGTDAADSRPSSLELPYVSNGVHRKNTQSAAPSPLTASAKPRTSRRNGVSVYHDDGLDHAPELGHSSYSEGENEEWSPLPEWELPLPAGSNLLYSLQQISMQTMRADPYLKQTASGWASSPPPATWDRHSTDTLNTTSEEKWSAAPGNRPALPGNGPALPGNRPALPGNRPALPGNRPALPGQKGRLTFAAVAAGYDRSPGAAGPGNAESHGKSLAHTSTQSHSSDSSELWSPSDTFAASPTFSSANSFSAFGPNNSFNLTGVFSGINVPKTSEAQLSWPDMVSVSALWDVTSSDPLSWPSSPILPSVPATSIFTHAWSSASPFGSSIWSAGSAPASPSFTPPSDATPLAGPPAFDFAAPPTPAELSPSYNPWSMWPTLSGRGPDP